MQPKRQFDNDRAERGAALLIAIFALLLISVVAIALIVSSGTDTALASNFRSSTNAYYAALAGVEEARGRLLPTNGNSLLLPGNCTQQFGLPMPLTQVFYILNPASGENVDPTNLSNPASYPDNEYTQEFGVPVTSRTVNTCASVSPVAGLPGPNYKWVRINAVTEKTLGDPTNGVDVNADGTVDSVTPLFYNPVNPNGSGGLSPGLIETATPPSTAGQALEITSYAVLPSGTQKMLQYVIRPMAVFSSLNLPLFPAALTLAGNNVTFSGPQTTGTDGFFIQGQDQCPGSSLVMPAIGYTNSSDNSFTSISAGATPGSSYSGEPPRPHSASPTWTANSFVNVTNGSNGANTINLNWLTPASLDAVVEDITNNADVVIQGPATPGSFPSGMSATHPMTIVVNGDLDLSSWRNTGYGLLLVTGTLHYDPDATWEGLVLVIGQGKFVSTSSGTGEIDGAVLIAQTRDASNNLLSSLGPASFSQTGNGNSLGKGIYYSSCIAKNPQQPINYPITYKIISFKEIPLS